MLTIGITTEDFCNYKKPSMIILFPNCSFKCEKEHGSKMCHSKSMLDMPHMDIPIPTLIRHYDKNPITSALVFSGLEPMDSFHDVIDLVSAFRANHQDDIVIYTGYNETEITRELEILQKYPNIIIKFGRYIPNQISHYDELLGVILTSPNQYAKLISKGSDK